MAANCISNLESAIQDVKNEYGNDPKWMNVIKESERVLSDAKALEPKAETSPGQKAANSVHEDIKAESSKEDPSAEKTEANETPAEEKAESPVEQKAEGGEEKPLDMKGAAKMALLLLRKK
jgi:hypothetical protein